MAPYTSPPVNSLDCTGDDPNAPSSLRRRKPKPVTLKRIEAALDTLAEIILKHGDVFIPIYERLERERDALLAKEAITDRIRQRAAKRKQ